jgi:putative spermidine/putrescine transport system ATP-binding protein
MSDRVAVFNDGAIQQIDAVERIYEEPANRFVAGFIGDSTVLDGTVRATHIDSASERCGIVLPDGRVITGLNVNGAEVGTRVQASVRPERIVLHTQAPAEHGNVLQSRVARAIYFGDHLRLLCEVGDAQAEATVKLPLSLGSVPRPGDPVWLEFPPEFTRIYR